MGIINIKIKASNVRERSGHGTRFNSALPPPYLKRLHNVKALLPCPHLLDASTGNFY
ncbi:MAG: hypothetical protein ACTXOO_03150 [Sodalis sp. (in: enterobacteria)]